MLDGKEQGWVDPDGPPSPESPAPFPQPRVSSLQSLKKLPVAGGAVLCEEEVMGWQASGGAEAALRLWGASPSALRPSDALKRALRSQLLIATAVPCAAGAGGQQ